MSTFALSSGSLVKPKSPKLGPQSSPHMGTQSSPKLIPTSLESPEVQTQLPAELSGVKVLTLNNILAISRAADLSQRSFESQPTHDFSLYQVDSEGSRSPPTPNPAHLISARKARQRMLPSMRAQQSPDQRNSLGLQRYSAARDPLPSPNSHMHTRPSSPRSDGTRMFGSGGGFAPAMSVNVEGERSPKAFDSPADEVAIIWRKNRELVGAASRPMQ
jgi:hypothetical protein